MKNIIWLILAGGGVFCYLHPTYVSSIISSPNVAGLIQNAGFESEPDLDVWMTRDQQNGYVLHIRSKDERELVISKVLLDNKEQDINNWSPHTVQVYNPAYKTTVTYPKRWNGTIWVGEMPVTTDNGEPKTIDKMTDDLTQMSLGDERFIKGVNPVKIEIVTNHGSHIGTFEQGNWR